MREINEIPAEKFRFVHDIQPCHPEQAKRVEGSTHAQDMQPEDPSIPLRSTRNDKRLS